MVVKRSEKIWTLDQDFEMSKHGQLYSFEYCEKKISNIIIFGDEIGKSIQMFHPII